MHSPLADRLRPVSLDEVVGQKHILGTGKVLRRIAESAAIPNMIFYGPSGVGKTTVARIIASGAGKKLFKLNGTTASTADIREVVSGCNTIDGIGGVILYLDEIQYLNKKQQQTLLEFLENGAVTMIASTTENPYFYIYNAILSRSTVFEFRPVPPEEIQVSLERAFRLLQSERQAVRVAPDVLGYISASAGGDVRKALNAAEILMTVGLEKGEITLEDAKQVSQRSAMRYDRDGDAHYDILSALQKSIRGSDENAALHYLARLLEAGDLLSPCRRLLVTASEDIGLAYPQAIAIVKACVDSALQIGLPEARIPLAQAVILLATSPKSNSAIAAIDAATKDIKAGLGANVPDFLRDGHYNGAKELGHGKDYQFPHIFKNHYVKQQYLPDELKGKTYYEFGDNKTESAARAYRQKLLDEA